MTVLEKIKALDAYCEKQGMCPGCALYNSTGGDCEVEHPWHDCSDKDIDKWYARCYGEEDDGQLTIFDTPDPTVGGEPKPDIVNHPGHYESGKFECIDVMIETQGVTAVMNFCICNAFKYLYRHNRKNGLEDIKKAIWYLNKYVELEESKCADTPTVEK